jgi:glycosyltransferase involved in cell wall biosynthesis
MCDKTKITVVTSTLNAASKLPMLIKSLEAQTSKNFYWIIIDGESTDETLQLTSRANIEKAAFYSERDCGIYDAINKGVMKCQTDYYIIAGSDDVFEPDAIENFEKALLMDPGYEFYAAAWMENGNVQRPKNGSKIKHGMRSISSCHSIGLLIKKDIHKIFGMYSMKFPICADYYFVKSALGKDRCRQKVVNFISGTYSTTGASARNYIDYIFDIYKIKTNYKFSTIQFIILILRLLRSIKL